MKKVLYCLLFVGSSLSIPTGTFDEFVEFFSRVPFAQLSFEDRCKTFCETVIVIDRLFDIFPELKCNKVCEDASEFSSQSLISAIANNDYEKVYYFLESPLFKNDFISDHSVALAVFNNAIETQGKKILLLFLRRQTHLNLNNIRVVESLNRESFNFAKQINMILNYNLSKQSK